MKGIIDMDNVVSNWIGWVFSQQEEVPKSAGLRSGKLEEMWPELTDEEVDVVVQDVRGYIDTDPVAGALEALWTLAKDPEIDLLYLSAAPLEVLEARQLWLRKYRFPYTPEEGIIDLVHTGSSDGKVSWIMDKCEEYDFIIDDSLPYLDAALLAGIPLRLVYSCLWNEDDDNHERVYSWVEALTKIRNGVSE